MERKRDKGQLEGRAVPDFRPGGGIVFQGGVICREKTKLLSGKPGQWRTSAAIEKDSRNPALGQTTNPLTG